jgi:hypothetical protein
LKGRVKFLEDARMGAGGDVDGTNTRAAAADGARGSVAAPRSIRAEAAGDPELAGAAAR